MFYIQQGESTKKRATEAALARKKRGLLALLLCCLSLWSWSFLLLGWLVELVRYEDNSVVLNAILRSPFLWLEVAFNGDHRSLGEAVE